MSMAAGSDLDHGMARLGHASPLSSHTTLVLNADMQPLSWMPLSTWHWQEAITAVLQQRVIQLCTYDDVAIKSAYREYPVPSVVCLRKYQRRKAVAFTRYNLFLRDGFQCQYCGTKKSVKDLTFDHVVPRSRGGASNFENIVAACAGCNLRKGNKTLREADMRLMRRPRTPRPEELDRVGRRLAAMHVQLHRTWMDYLYWGSDLDRDD
jgi:5-methylcytosine-specific restriction endonuclease McrA